MKTEIKNIFTIAMSVNLLLTILVNYLQKNYWKKIYETLVTIHGEPRNVALGFALGLFIGMAPIMGLQTLLVLFLATFLKWNKLSAAIGVWITNPLTAPFIYGMTYLTGARIMGLKKAHYIVDPEQSITIISKIITKAPNVFFSLIIGGIILGIPVAIIGYYFSYYAVLEYQTDIKKKIVEKKEKLARRRQRSKGQDR